MLGNCLIYVNGRINASSEQDNIMDRNNRIGAIIRSWIEAREWKQKQLAEMLGIKPPSLSQMLSGRIPFPKDKLMKTVALLAPSPEDAEQIKKIFLGENENSATPPLPPPTASQQLSPATRLDSVPVISFAQAAGYEPALEPIDDYAKGCSDETALFSQEIRPGYFALNVEGDSMAPDFPHGTVILVAGGEFPQRGDVVVAKLRDGQVVVKRYFRHNNMITLESINPEGRAFQWHCKEDPGFIQWMYPVLEATIDLRRRRWEQLRHQPNYNYEAGARYAVAEDGKKYPNPTQD